MMFKTFLIFTLFNSLYLPAYAVDIKPGHVWMTPDGIGFRADGVETTTLKRFLDPLKAGYSEPTFKKGEFMEVVVKTFLKMVFYVEVRGIYHIGTYEERGRCNARAAQHTWVNIESIDKRDISATSLPKEKYKIPPLLPKDWRGIGELSITQKTEPSALKKPCKEEKKGIEIFYKASKKKFLEFLTGNHKRIMDVFYKLASEGKFGDKSVEEIKILILNNLNNELKKLR